MKWLLEDPNGVVVDDTFTYVQLHAADLPNCPTWPARVSFYKDANGNNLWTGTPMIVFDGYLHQEGTYTNYQTEYNTVLGYYNSRRAAPTDVSVSVTAVQVSGSTFTIRARVCLDADGQAKTVRVYIVQLLDHWPTTCSYCRNCFMQVATTDNGVSLTPGQCHVTTRTMTFNTNSWNHQSDIRIVAWAQTNVDYGRVGASTQIYNGRSLAWPFPPDCNTNGMADSDDIASGESEDCNANDIPDECDVAGGFSQDCNNNHVPDECDIAGGTPDCNVNGVPDSCDIDSGYSQDANGNGIPDECEGLKGDLNCDGTVYFSDINPFVMYLSNFAQWQATYEGCDPANGDVNEDGTYPSFSDINPFVGLLTG